MNDNKRTKSAGNLQNDRGGDNQFSCNQYGQNSGDWQYDNKSFSTNAVDSSVNRPLHSSGDSQNNSSYRGQQRNAPYRSGQHRDSTQRSAPSRNNSSGSNSTWRNTSRDNSMRGGPSRDGPYRAHPYRRSPSMDNPARERINSYRAYDRSSERETPQTQSSDVGGILGRSGGNTSKRHDTALGDCSYNGDTNYRQVAPPPPPCLNPAVSGANSGNQGINDFLAEKLGEYSVNSSAEAQQALKIINMFLKPIQEYNIKLQDAKAIALVSVAEMNIQTLMERDIFS
ncbi:uncharacterized protein LOC134786370 isoform X1 [Penaeus indicus]|uniref:uncharacterized protein LOC134786370 isoform X1 n=1 Tax=Penaeus indicus TaxID=29960 RepID=UPI00300CA620